MRGVCGTVTHLSHPPWESLQSSVLAVCPIDLSVWRDEEPRTFLLSHLRLNFLFLGYIKALPVCHFCNKLPQNGCLQKGKMQSFVVVEAKTQKLAEVSEEGSRPASLRDFAYRPQLLMLVGL